MPAISESAGWGPASWWPRSNFAGCKDTNRFPSFSENWKRWFLPRRRLSNAGRRRRVSYARAATFNGKSGDPLVRVVHIVPALFDLNDGIIGGAERYVVE